MAPPQVCDGKMPWSAMQRLRVRNGCMFRCAWLPPTLARVDGSNEVRLVIVEQYSCVAGLARMLLAGGSTRLFVVSRDACAECTWVGISEIDNVWPCSPPRSPRVWLLPMCIGVMPCRLGSPKLTRPSPP